MKTIVCPTDFTPISLNAANYAADMAAMLSTNLALIHVCAIPMAAVDGSYAVYPSIELLKECDRKIDALKQVLVARTGGKVLITTEVREGYVVPEIHDFSHKLDAYAIVMGAERPSRFERIVSGAITFSAMSQLPWPVITVPDGAKFSGIKKIGLACDLKNVVEATPLQQLKRMVKLFNAEFHVLHVNFTAGSFTPEEVTEASFLQEMIGDLHPVYHFMDGNDVVESICEFADEHDFDILVVFPKRHTILSRILQHSHAKKLVLQTHIPVLSMHEEHY